MKNRQKNRKNDKMFKYRILLAQDPNEKPTERPKERQNVELQQMICAGGSKRR